jgi:hypothetical protein
MLNETITQMLDVLTSAGVVWWMHILMIIGGLWLVTTLLKSGVNIVYLIAYIVGFFKFVYDKIMIVKKKKRIKSENHNT